ncbi:MAG: hypothetical protein RJA99_1572 [Pseudomonadota bacterium]|jgi:hypothetical protein
MTARAVLRAACALALTAAAAPAGAGCEAVAARIAPRDPAAPGGTEFVRRLDGLSEPERDLAIRSALLAGNLPGFLRRAVPLELAAPPGGMRTPRVTVCVLPDYLAVGSDDDHVRVPMSLHAASAIAHAFGFTLPTRRLVDAIYAQAAVRLEPRPLPAGDAMRSTAYFVRHDAIVRAQRDAQPAPRGALVAGHKKDLVLTGRLRQAPDRLALYGWHRGPSAPIQPLSLVHGARYADYSHGVRLVAATAWVDGRARPIGEVLRDARLSAALSDEGPIELDGGT